MDVQHSAPCQWPRVPAAVRIWLAGDAAPPQEHGIELVEIRGRKLLQGDMADVATGDVGLPAIGGERCRTMLAAIGKRRQPALNEDFERMLLGIADAALFDLLLHSGGMRLGVAGAVEVLAALDPPTARAGLLPDGSIDHAAGRRDAPMDACHCLSLLVLRVKAAASARAKSGILAVQFQP